MIKYAAAAAHSHCLQPSTVLCLEFMLLYRFEHQHSCQQTDSAWLISLAGRVFSECFFQNACRPPQELTQYFSSCEDWCMIREADQREVSLTISKLCMCECSVTEQALEQPRKQTIRSCFAYKYRSYRCTLNGN